MNCSKCPQILEATTKLTPCECSGPGYCPRHKMDKPAHFHMLCKTNAGYFQLYERGVGPGHDWGKTAVTRFGLGDLVAWLIRVVTLGRLTPCMSCKSRMAWLNRITLWRRRR